MNERLTFWLAFGVASFAAVRASHAEGTAEPTVYTVQAGDTCVGIATRFYGDKRFVDVIHSANPGMGPVPHNLKAGTRLVLPPKPADLDVGKPDATVTRVRNHVEVTTTVPKPAKGNDPLFRGNRVGTRVSSAADVTFRDETQVKLGENTLIVILGDTDARATRVAGTDMTLVTGELRARLSELAGGPRVEPRVTTDAGVVALKGGEAKVTSDETKTTRVAVYSGGSTLTAQKKTVAVNDGFGSKAPRGAAPTPPQPLPPPPGWVSPSRDLVVALAPVDLDFAFAPSAASDPPAASWHVQLARDARFDDIVVDEKVPLAVGRIEAKNAGGGTYFARVSAIDADRFEGKWGPVARTEVGRLDTLPIGGRRTRLSLDGEGVTCTVDGAPAVFPHEIDRDRAHAVACSKGATSAPPIVIPMTPLGAAQVYADVTSAKERAGVVRVTVVDGAGYRVSHMHPVVEPVRGLQIGDLRESETKGVYVGSFAWSAPPHPTAFRVRVLEDAVFETNEVAFARDPSTVIELGAAGVGSWRGSPPVGAGFEVETRVPIETTGGTFLVGASAGWEKLFEATRGGMSADASAIMLRALGGYRFGHGRLGPYVTLGPEVVRQQVRIKRTEGRQWFLGGSAGVGLDVVVGPGAFFVEGRAQIALPVDREEPFLPATTGLGLLGYRLRLR